MQKITVEPGTPRDNGYTIHIGAGALEQAGSLYDFGKYSSVFVLTDETLEPLLLETLQAALPAKAMPIVLPAGEKQKDIDTVQKVWQALLDGGADRQSLLINLGGGVIGDIGGFAASAYMRGIDFLNVPTTLLSQVDSSIGGKTGINFGGIKNLIGSFNQPRGIIIDVGTLQSLPERELTAGFGEIIKHGLVWDAGYFEQAIARKPAEFTKDEMAGIIAGSCRIKLAIIQNDIREGGIRKLVNFGHTVGHAVEALSLRTDTPLLHGEAVSIGMIAEAAMAVKLDLLASADLDRVKQALEHAGLPVSVKSFTVGDILKKMESDKKNTAGSLKFTMIDRIGHAVYDQDVPAPVVTEAIHVILD
jgi:3-dehydroquinate synthase